MSMLLKHFNKRLQQIPNVDEQSVLFATSLTYSLTNTFSHCLRVKLPTPFQINYAIASGSTPNSRNFSANNRARCASC
jgi:hypothetical protein